MYSVSNKSQAEDKYKMSDIREVKMKCNESSPTMKINSEGVGSEGKKGKVRKHFMEQDRLGNCPLRMGGIWMCGDGHSSE